MCTNILECTHNHQEFMVQINELLTNFFYLKKKKKKEDECYIYYKFYYIDDRTYKLICHKL